TGGRTGLSPGVLSIQTQLSPVITLAPDGRTAQGRWRVLIQDAEYGSSANWGSGVYENSYVKQDGAWKISRLKLYVRFHVPYDKGWTAADATLNARYGRSTARADRASTQRYGTWSEHFIAPMHFAGEAPGSYRLSPSPAPRATVTDAAPAADAPPL